MGYVGVVVVMIAICGWLVVRRSMLGTHRDKELTTALSALSVAFLLSLPATNDPLDQALGGVSAVNTFSHCLICLCGWLMARSFFASSAGNGAGWARSWGVLAFGIIGTIISWLASAVFLGQPRVVHDSLLSAPYWTFTLTPYLVMLAPSLRAPGQVRRWVSGRGKGWSRGMLMGSYGVAALAYSDIAVGLAVLWVAEIFPEPHLVALREVMIYLGPFLLLSALMLCPVSTRFEGRLRPGRARTARR